MNPLEQLFDDVARLTQLLEGSPIWKPPRLERASIVGAVERLADPQQPGARLRAFAGGAGASDDGPDAACVGWVETLDEVRTVAGADDLPEGIVLNAELVRGRRSLHVRHLGASWSCVVHEERRGDGDGDGDDDGGSPGDGCVVERRLAAADPRGGEQVYRVEHGVLADGRFVARRYRLARIEHRAPRGDSRSADPGDER